MESYARAFMRLRRQGLTSSKGLLDPPRVPVLDAVTAFFPVRFRRNRKLNRGRRRRKIESAKHAKERERSEIGGQVLLFWRHGFGFAHHGVLRVSRTIPPSHRSDTQTVT